MGDDVPTRSAIATLKRDTTSNDADRSLDP